MIKVLFVCLGNICRSPTAHGVFQTIIDNKGLSDCFEIDSAGTAAWHEGKSPDPRTQKHALIRSYDLSELRARQVKPTDFEKFDFILAMDHSNLANLKEICPENLLHKLKLFLEFGNGDELEVPDPYYGGSEGFDHVLDLVESASEGLLSYMIDESLV